MNIYVGSLPYATTEDALKALFEQFGQVTSAKIIMDKFSGKSKGFGFVEMPSDEDAQQAIEALNGTEYEGQRLRISEARQPERRGNGPRGPRSGGGGRRF